MSFLLYEQILVEFGVSKKVLASSGEHHEVINAIKTACNIKEEIFLQKFDQEWKEYIDCPEEKFENKARVKVILKVSCFSSFSFQKLFLALLLFFGFLI